MTDKDISQMESDLALAAAQIAKVAKTIAFYKEQNRKSEVAEPKAFVPVDACIYCKKIDCECTEQDLVFDFGAKG